MGACRYADKDALLERFYQTGSFADVRTTYPVRLRSPTELLAVWAVLITQAAFVLSLYRVLSRYLV
jgi:hypothetical protein